MRRAVLLLLPILAVAALAGCGETDNSKDFKGAQQDVAQAIDDLGSHARKLEAAKICDRMLTPDLKAKLAVLAKRSGRGSDCADQLKDSLRDADAFEMDVQSMRIDGSTAAVTVKVKTSADRDPVSTLQLVNQRGWRLAQLP